MKRNRTLALISIPSFLLVAALVLPGLLRPLMADGQGLSSSVSGWAFTQERIHQGLVRLRNVR